MLRAAVIFCLIFSMVMGSSVAEAANADLAITAGNIRFSVPTLYAGDSVRIYAKVRNLGDADMSGHVLFYQGSLPIEQSQAVSLPAGGSPDEVYIDFVVPVGTFNIRAVIQGTSPQDVNPENDVAITPLYTPIVDADRDGITDEGDNCRTAANADQADSDGDGMGDVCDDDDDNDGVSDGNDPSPLDPSVRERETPIPAPTPVPAAVVVSPVPVVSVVTPAEPSTVPVASAPVIVSSDLQPEPTPSVAVTGSSKLSISPHARFTYRQVDWRSYEFAIAEQPEDGVQFSWDFGDGASSVQPKITHAFAGSGTFVVTLAIVTDDGVVASDAQTLEISLFHLNNPLVQVLLALLALFVGAFTFTALKLKRAYDQKTAE